jgi:chromosome segregation ATPase
MRHGLPFAFCLVVAAAVPAIAEEAMDAESTTLVEEVAGLRGSVDQLVTLLERHMKYQKTELILKRLDLKERQLQPLERELRATRDDLEYRNEELDELGMYLAQVESEIEEEIRVGTDSPDSHSRRAREEVEERRKNLEERIVDLERRILDLEGEVAFRQREIDDLEDILEDYLEE